MHEASLVHGLVRQIEAVMARERASRAMSARVWIGALTHLSAAHFRKHFEVAAAGSVAAGMELHIVLSADIHHPQAEAVLLRSVEVED